MPKKPDSKTPKMSPLLGSSKPSGKKGGRGDMSESDDSVDSNGDLRGFIDNDYDTNSDSSYYSESDSPGIKNNKKKGRRPRKAAILASKRIRNQIKMENSSSEKRSKTNSTLQSPNRRKSSRVDMEDDTNSDDENAKLLQQVIKAIQQQAISSKSEKKNNKNQVMKDESDEETDYSDEELDDDSSSSNGSLMSDEDTMTDVTETEEEDIDIEYSDDEDDESGEAEEEHNIMENHGLILSMGSSDPMVPKRYNMKKEPKSVQDFVKLVTTPLEDNTIDAQIDQFKALSELKQKELLEALEKRPTITDTGVNLMLRILTMKLPQEVKAMILAKYNSLQNMDPSSTEYFKLRNWLDKAVSIPFGEVKGFPVKIEDGNEACASFMEKARKCLDEAIFGQDESKLQIMQFITTKLANPDMAGTCLLLVGPPGIGKTSLIKNGIAKALDWPFQFISLGGDSDASTYTGHQLVYESSHCGKIVNSLVAAKSMSSVILFDEVDKISATAKGEEVQNILIHLTDPAANTHFEDKYLAGVPIDLSKVMFVFSANDINKIDKILLDRLMVINLNGYDMKQKITIAEQYILPGALKDVNLVERVAISRDILKYIIEEYANEEKGVRELKRCIEQVAQKINMLRIYNSKDLPFHIKDFSLPFVVKKEHIDLFIKKKEDTNKPPTGMYI
jgi:ATP-dependent Lon protease